MTRNYLYVYTRAMMALLVAFFALIYPVSLVAQTAQNYPVQLKWHGVETERYGDMMAPCLFFASRSPFMMML